MDHDIQLEQFREKWKEELKQRGEPKPKETKHYRVVTQNKSHSQTPAVSPGMSSVNSRSYFNEDIESLEQNSKAKGNLGRTRRTEYYPFSIVDGLLNDTGNETVKEGNKRKNIDRDVSYCANIVKQQKSNHGTLPSLKKMKFANFKNLFTNLWKKQNEAEPEQCLLDKLIADIDEITEIPFFDISLPREIAVRIFQFLNMSDLCHCAQVSKSWRSIAEDELLWCRICHRLGQEVLYTTKEKTNWKEIVQHNVERQRLLELNWKGRLGKLTQLDHHQGKILSAVTSNGSQVIAGYTSGDVKLWDLATGDSCVYSPSSTSLVILEDEANTVGYNFVESIVSSETVAAAAYSQGNVDIWNLGADTQPAQTYIASSRNKGPPTLCLSRDGSALCVSHGTDLDLLYRNKSGTEFKVVQQLFGASKFSNIKFIDNSTSIIPNILYSEGHSVKIFKPADPERFGSESHVTEIHSMIGASVDALDHRDKIVGVGIGSSYDLADRYKINLYDITNGKNTQTLLGHTWSITCMNMLESPERELVTGSADRKVRVYDLRMQEPVQTFIRHSCSVTSVQMDGWKVVSAAYDGFMCLFDRRMGRELWDLHNRHPVKHCHYHDKYLVVANIPGEKFAPESNGFEISMQRRYRGTINVYNFLEDMTTQDVPEICLSTYEEPDASRYNISLAVPYDTLQF